MKKYLILALAAVAFASCQPDENSSKPLGEPAKTNRRIYDIMKKNYLWSESLPSFDASAPNTGTQKYFDEKLRYRDNRSVSWRNDTYGDRFSHIAKPSPATRAGVPEMLYDSGFFPVIVSGAGGEIVFLQVCYVTPGSPADGKLRRGDAFRKINGTVVDHDNINRLLAERSMEIEVFDYEQTSTRTVTIECDGYYETPIVAEAVYEGRNTAYLAYTGFVMEGPSGPMGSMSDLRAAFKRFKDAGVRNLVLDLRYNGGGIQQVAVLLASLISRQSDLGKVFMYSRGNDGVYEKDNFLTQSYVMENADIQTLVVLTSDVTASASELIIHCLKPYFGNDMCVFGETTVGKNVGSGTITDKESGWEVSPIMIMAYDRDKVSGYEEGIAPDVHVNEFVRYRGSTSPFFDMGTLGDYESEYQLNVAMRSLFPDIAPIELAGPGSRSATRDVSTMVMVPERGLSIGRVEAACDRPR